MISDSSCSEFKSTLQIPDGCSQTAVCKSLREKRENCFDRVPLFQVYFYGLGTQLWKLDVKLDNGALVSNKWLRNKIRSPIQKVFKETLSDPDYHCFRTWFSQRGNNNRKWMKITDYTEPYPGIPPNFWGVMSDGDELPDFTPGYAEACFGVDACPASGGGGQSAAAPAAATAPGAAATPAPSFPAVDPAAPIRGADRAVAMSCSGPPHALARGTPASAAFVAAASGAAVS